jgi:hypothetical protein
MNDETDEPPATPTEQKLTQILSLLGLISDQLDGQGDALNFIARCVAPKEDGDGHQLEELLKQLIGRLDKQSATLRMISDGMTRMGKTLPLDIVRAIDDNLANSEAPGNGTRSKGGNGHGPEQRP